MRPLKLAFGGGFLHRTPPNPPRGRGCCEDRRAATVAAA